MDRIGLVIPTLNAGNSFETLLDGINEQACVIKRKLITDSGSTDRTVHAAKEKGFEVFEIQRTEFNHGGTRQRAFEMLEGDVDFIIYLTQDVLLYDKHSFSNLLQAFHDADIGAAYGRQLPHEGASLQARMQREFNYPDQSMVKSFADKERLGIKAAFLSDSFAAYRCNALKVVGGFPVQVIACEDMYVAAKMLIKGYKIAYSAEAKVYHSHDYTIVEELKRYFDTGVFHGREKWIADAFGKSEGEGMKLMKFQWDYLKRERRFASVVNLFVGNIIKYFAYQHGRRNI